MPELLEEVKNLANVLRMKFTPPDFVPGCEVQDITDKDLYTTSNGWIEAYVGAHGQQRVRYYGEPAGVGVGDFVDVEYFPHYRLYRVFSATLGGTAAAGGIRTDRLWESDFGAIAMQTDADGGVGINAGTAIPRGGIGGARFQIHGTANNTATGPHVQYTTSQDDYPVHQGVYLAHDNILLLFDSYYDGSYKSSDAGSNFRLQKSADTFSLHYGSGNAQGASVGAWEPVWQADTFSRFGIGNSTLAENLSVQGDSAADTNVGIYAGDGDRSDSVSLSVYGLGTPGNSTNRERLISQFVSGSNIFRIQSEANGTGTVRDLIIETDGNTNQIQLSSNGNTVFGAGDILPSANIVRSGDTDTYIGLTSDDVEVFAGGVSLLKLTEDTQDVVRFGPGSGDVDLNFNGDMFIQGSDGNVGIGTTSVLNDWLTVWGSNTDYEGIFVQNSNNTDANTGAQLNLQASVGAAQRSTTLRQNSNNATQAIGGALDTILVNNYTTSNLGHMIFATNAAERVRIEHNGNVGIGDSSPNSKLVVSSDVFIGPAAASGNTSSGDVTVGLVINQEANDNQILALKSSDVAHGITTVAETDTYCYLGKETAVTGGLDIAGFSEADVGFKINGYYTNDTTSKTTSSQGPIILSARKKSGTSPTTAGSNANLVVMQNYTTTRWILDAEGDIFYGGADGGTITDDYDDTELLVGFRAIMSPKDSPAYNRFKGFLDETEEILVRQGVLTAPTKEGGLISDTGLKGLLIDAIYQLNDKINVLEDKLNNIAKYRSMH